MNTTRSLFLRIAAIGLALTFALSTQARQPARDEIIYAYQLMQNANGEYNGHRVKAMDEIREAGKSVHLSLSGDTSGKSQRQWRSDEAMAEARRLLADARNRLSARDREQAAAHLEHAIQELNLALDHAPR